MVVGGTGFELHAAFVRYLQARLRQHQGRAILAFLVAAPTLIVTSSPRKLLVFSDHLRVKRRAWHSRILEPDDIADISIRRFPGVWLSRELLRGAPLTFGLWRPGIHLRPVRGRSYFFRSRDTEELAEVLGEWWGRPVVGGADGADDPNGPTGSS